MSEDCLHLDVWVPGKGAPLSRPTVPVGRDAKRPVLVWIYGGGLVGGTKDDPAPCGVDYAERGVILVAINYRVGALGFLWPPGGDPNCGIWDQVAALTWVQKEIGAFGGDSNRVTIMGQSAGADSCYWLSASPLANKLFQRAIIMSPSSFVLTPPQAREVAEEFAAVAGSKTSTLVDMQALSADAVIETQLRGRFRIHPTTGPGWREMGAGGSFTEGGPFPDPSPAGLWRFPKGQEPTGWPLPVAVVDGELLAEPPLNALANGVAAHLDIVVGANANENGFLPQSAQEPTKARPGCCGRWVPSGEPREELVKRMAWELAGAPAVRHAPAEEVRKHVQAIMPGYEEELQSSGIDLEAPAASQWLQNAVASDFSFLAATLLIAERLSRPGRCQKVYRYQFNGYEDPVDAFHGAELEMVIDAGCKKHRSLLGARTAWRDSWASFARGGDPNTAEMAGAWQPFTGLDGSVMLWDAKGWRADGGPALAKRTGLMATAQLWEVLWEVESRSFAGASCSVA